MSRLYFLKSGIVIVFSIVTVTLFAQRKDSTIREIMMIARPSLDSVVLRWAPPDRASWIRGNQFGYQLIRYTIVRDKKMLPDWEVKTLINNLKPKPLDDWESLVKRNKYGAIAAQSLYGDSFQLNMQGTDVFQIVNKAKENDQRFSFALFAADMSAPVSVYLGLRYTDKEVIKGERYLYRLMCISQPGSDTLKGSVFTGPEEYELPAPLELTADFKGRLVSLKWNQYYYERIYTAFVIERSYNGKDFKLLSEDPLLTLTSKNKEEDRYQYATDSLPDPSLEYHYRIRGLTPFGELGPPSEVVKGKATVEIKESPHIINGMSENNKTIKIEWEFSAKLNDGIKGFQIKSTVSPKQNYKPIHDQLLPKEQRVYEDINPKQTNYYQVVAVALNGKEFISPVYYAQLVDSIPPLAPKGLEGKVSETGKISISWLPNTEEDIYGYRIYRGNYKKEEFSQITREPIPQTSFNDSVNLKTLNRHIHYQIMAIDRRQNHSPLSDIFTLELPDKVKPVPPVFLPVISSREGVNLQWIPSSSEDVNRYDAYRKEGQVWKKIFSISNTADSVYSFMDKESVEGKRCFYTLVAIDKSGNESEPTSPVTGTKILNAIKEPVTLKDPTIDRQNRKITLHWNYALQDVSGYQIYRAKEGQAMKLVATVSSSSQLFEDKYVTMNTTYLYRVMALFSTGAKSEFSKELKINY